MKKPDWKIWLKDKQECKLWLDNYIKKEIINEKELNKTINKLVRITYMIKGFEWKSRKCIEDRTALIIEK